MQADVAILWDWESFWAQDLEWRPSVDLDHRERTVAFYTRLWRDNITVDFAHPGADLDGYRLVVVPQMYLVDEHSAQNLRSYVERGGRLLVSYFTGVVDRTDTVHAEGLAGPLGDVLGISVKEFAPLTAGETVHLRLADGYLSADVWVDRLAVTGSDTEVVARFVDGPAADKPAITRRPLGAGEAWYLATRLDVDALATVLAPLYDSAGLPRTAAPEDMEIVTRTGDAGRFRVIVNHSSSPAAVPGEGVDAVTGTWVEPGATVPAGGVLVLREETDTEPEG